MFCRSTNVSKNVLNSAEMCTRIRRALETKSLQPHGSWIKNAIWKVTISYILVNPYTNTFTLDKIHIISNIDLTFLIIGVTMIVTKTGVGKYKTIQKKGSTVLEWTSCFMDCGYTSVIISKQYTY